MNQLELYEREVIARERQAEALERIANALNVNAIDTRHGISNIAEAVACLVYAINDKDSSEGHPHGFSTAD